MVSFWLQCCLQSTSGTSYCFDKRMSELPPVYDRLSLTGVRELPPALFQLGQLTKLSLVWYQMPTLPAEIGLLTQLKKLCIGNILTCLPKEIGQLSCLEKLYLQNNRLES